VSLIRLAIVTLGDRAAAEDVVQDAFFGLRWRTRHSGYFTLWSYELYLVRRSGLPACLRGRLR
jgi:hypothetical protein